MADLACTGDEKRVVIVDEVQQIERWERAAAINPTTRSTARRTGRRG